MWLLSWLFVWLSALSLWLLSWLCDCLHCPCDCWIDWLCECLHCHCDCWVDCVIVCSAIVIAELIVCVIVCILWFLSCLFPPFCLDSPYNIISELICVGLYYIERRWMDLACVRLSGLTFCLQSLIVWTTNVISDVLFTVSDCLDYHCYFWRFVYSV